MADVGACPVAWAEFCRRGGVAGPLGPVMPRAGGSVLWASYGRRVGMAALLGPVWQP